MDEKDKIRCPECRKVLAAKAGKGKVEVRVKTSRTRTVCVEIVVGAVICPACRYRLSVPVSSLEQPRGKPRTTSTEARDARGL